MEFFEDASVEVAGREFPQVLLIHDNALNADLMPDLLEMFRRRGYGFVSLEAALADDAYRLPEGYVGRGGFSWIDRWSMTKGMTSQRRAGPAGLGHYRVRPPLTVYVSRPFLRIGDFEITSFGVLVALGALAGVRVSARAPARGPAGGRVQRRAAGVARRAGGCEADRAIEFRGTAPFLELL